MSVGPLKYEILGLKTGPQFYLSPWSGPKHRPKVEISSKNVEHCTLVR